MTTLAAAPPARIGRTVLALAVGFVVVAALSLGTDLVLHATGVFPPWAQRMSDGLFGLATTYRAAYAVLGSYLTARFAPRKPLAHAMLGGAIGMGLATAGAVATWNMGPEFGPHWYPVLLIATALPCAWAGGALFAGSTRRAR